MESGRRPRWPRRAAAWGAMKGGGKAPVSLLLSLRGRLLFLTCLATLPAILFTFVVAQNERSSMLARTERDAFHLAHLASREHTHQIRGARELLSWLGAQLARDGLRSPILRDSTFLEALLAGHPQLANVGVLSPEGDVLASAYPLASYRSWTDNPAYIAALGSRDVAVGTYLVSPIFERPTLNHAYAVRDRAGDVLAVLFDGLDLGWLTEMAGQSDLPEGFFLLIVDREGRVLAVSDPGDAAFGDAGEMRIPDPSALEESRSGRMVALEGAGGSRYLVTAPLSEAPGLFAAVALPFDQVVRQANSVFYRTLAGLGILTLFVIAAVFIATEFAILRGLRGLARAVQRFGGGDFSARAGAPRTGSELAALAATFNAMADALAARHAEAVDAQVRLRALAGRLHGAREAEAARISRELHDEMGQVLTSLKIDLSRLCSCCPPGDQTPACAAALREATATTSRQIDAAIGVVRRLSSDLRPGVLDKLGLVAALEWLAHDIEARTGLAVQVEADLDDNAAGEQVALTLFRIAQEALNNVVRHADASVVDIDLSTIGSDIVLSVRDDGVGISEAEVESGDSLGIIGMRERAALIEGRLSIGAAGVRGTTVRITAPLRPTPGGDDAHPAG